MISFCRQIYVDNPNAIVILDEFEQSFIPELSIYWYTRECFLYKMLNKALWTPQPDVLYKLRYFIRHLYYQILSQAQTQRDQLSSMIVYRGQTMSADQINKLKQNVGGFLSFNNFLSTSLEKDVARNFLIGSEEIGVLFEMQIDPTIEKFPMINIELISYLKKEDCEQELLFAMGSVFRIIRIEQQENNLYRVQLKLSEDVDQELAEYTKRTREKTRTSHSFLSLLRLMNELSQYSYVDQFAEMLREDVALSANPSLLATVHHIFGSIYHGRGQHKEALDYYQKSLNINLSYLSANDSTLAVTYNNMGCVYLSQSNYNKALEFQKLALDCESNSKNPNSSLLILYANNLGKVYHHQEKYKEALDYYKRAVELKKQFLGENDPSLTETYNMISSIYHKMNDYGQAG
jgi:tetratricopeptide (TPR) repeat protein